MSGSTSSPQKCARISPVIEADENETDNQKMYSCDSDRHNLGISGSCMEGYDKAPIVLVHAIFGFGEQKLGTMSYWGGDEKRDDRFLAPDLGALSSIHDRTCLLFYYLKGGTVDYGVERSEKYGHSRFGHTSKHGEVTIQTGTANTLFICQESTLGHSSWLWPSASEGD